MNRITKVDGYSYKMPDRMPYYNDDVKSCKDALCNKKLIAHEKADCPCFYYKEFALGKIIQVELI
jgi:hypothetical protein